MGDFSCFLVIDGILSKRIPARRQTLSERINLWDQTEATASPHFEATNINGLACLFSLGNQ